LDNSSSSSGAGRDQDVKKFTLSTAKSTQVAKWVVSSSFSQEVKAAREACKPKLKKRPDFLENPVLDETVYLRLKSVKRSNASKANIDQAEKSSRRLSFKILDLAKPLMFLFKRASVRRKSRADTKAIRSALKLWGLLYGDVLYSHRLNILNQIYPKYVNLLENKKFRATEDICLAANLYGATNSRGQGSVCP
jgi:hypothetical protein